MTNSKRRVWCSIFHFFHLICNISNFNMWTAKHLAQASCTELTLRCTMQWTSMVAYLAALLYQLASPAHTHAQPLGTLNWSFSQYFNPILIKSKFEKWHYCIFSISSVQCVTECAIRPPRGPCAPHMTLSKDILSSCYRKGKAHLPFSAFGKKTATFWDSCFWAN